MRLRHRALLGLIAVSLVGASACSSEPEETREQTLARLTASDEEIDAELAAEREAAARVADAAARAAAEREAEHRTELEEHHQRLDEARAKGDSEAAALLAEQQRREAEAKLNAITAQSAQAGGAAGRTPASGAASGEGGSSDQLIAEWTPKFDALRADHAGTRSAVAAAERDQADLTRRFQTSDNTMERSRLQGEIGALRSKIERLRAEAQGIERAYGELQQQARRAGVPAIAYRRGVK